MASFRRQKEALRAAVFAYVAGAHYVTEIVEKAQSLTSATDNAEIVEARHAMLAADFKRITDSPTALSQLVEILDEEELYPFGSEWPAEALVDVLDKLIPPRLSSTEEGDSEMRFRFKIGFKKTLSDMAGSVESSGRPRSTLDHWLVLLINAAFHAGATIAAGHAENSRAYYAAITEMEEEVEPWGRYPQLVSILEKQLRRETRRRTGLVSDLDY